MGAQGQPDRKANVSVAAAGDARRRCGGWWPRRRRLARVDGGQLGRRVPQPREPRLKTRSFVAESGLDRRLASKNGGKEGQPRPAGKAAPGGNRAKKGAQDAIKSKEKLLNELSESIQSLLISRMRSPLSLAHRHLRLASLQSGRPS